MNATRNPRRLRLRAPTAPAGPPPATTTSNDCVPSEAGETAPLGSRPGNADSRAQAGGCRFITDFGRGVQRPLGFDDYIATLHQETQTAPEIHHVLETAQTTGPGHRLLGACRKK